MDISSITPVLAVLLPINLLVDIDVEITGVVPPVDVIGLVAVTDVTVPVGIVGLLSIKEGPLVAFQSAFVPVIPKISWYVTNLLVLEGAVAASKPALMFAGIEAPDDDTKVLIPSLSVMYCSTSPVG
jgi:hypothetical protein